MMEALGSNLTSGDAAVGSSGPMTGDMPDPNPVDASNTPRPWNLAARLGFRFAFCYLTLCCLWMAGILRYLVIAFAWHSAPHGLLDPLWRRVVPWVALHWLRIRADAGAPGGSDTVFEYVQVLCQLWLAAGAALVWSVLDRQRTEYRVLREWLRRTVSLLLACVLFFYGTDKVFPLQFGRLSLVRLSERVGDLDRFNVLWTFMAASTPYTVFSGAMEILAGLLLLVRRCETAGALLSIGVLMNVLVLNLAYDVPVKLLSSHLLLCALFLAACAGTRLARAIFSDCAMAQRPRILLSRRRWVNRSVALAHPAAGLAMLAVFSVLIFRTYHLVYAPAAPSPLYGIWSVDEFRAAGNPGGPLLTPRVASALSIHPGEDRWRELIIDAPRRAAIRLGNGKLDSISVAVDPGGEIATFTDPGDTEWKCDFRMERPDRDSLHLDGRINGIESSVQLHRVSPETLRLTGDRFHWVR